MYTGLVKQGQNFTASIHGLVQIVITENLLPHGGKVIFKMESVTLSSDNCKFSRECYLQKYCTPNTTPISQ